MKMRVLGRRWTMRVATRRQRSSAKRSSAGRMPVCSASAASDLACNAPAIAGAQFDAGAIMRCRLAFHLDNRFEIEIELVGRKSSRARAPAERQ